MSSISPDRTIVAAQKLTRQHGAGKTQRAVVAEVSFTLKRGEFLAIMGPSGSGKSTLLHLLSGLDEPSSGRVLLDGTDIGELSLAARTKKRRDVVAHVFQFFNLMPNLSVRENVALPLAIRGERPASADAKIDGLLERLGLSDRARALPHELSGGEMQRCSIARALAGDQPLLLCDEPTGNLSQKAGFEVMKTLQNTRDRDDKTILLVTHNPRDAAFADRVLFLVDGRLAEASELRGPGLKVDDIHAALAALAI